MSSRGLHDQTIHVRRLRPVVRAAHVIRRSTLPYFTHINCAKDNDSGPPDLGCHMNILSPLCNCFLIKLYTFVVSGQLLDHHMSSRGLHDQTIHVRRLRPVVRAAHVIRRSTLPYFTRINCAKDNDSGPPDYKTVVGGKQGHAL